MMNLVEALGKMEYPGRLLAAGMSPEGDIAIVYLITGRSASSQARRLVLEGNDIEVRPTDEDLLKKGKPELLVYKAMALRPAGAVVSNGKQTEDIISELGPGRKASEILESALRLWEYEPDAPIYTPRISGCLIETGIGLAIVKRGPEGKAVRQFFDFRLQAGRGFLLSTYSGPNRDPLPVFEGSPVEVGFPESGASRLAESVYGALTPSDPEKDFRVAAACAVFNPGNPLPAEFKIINRHERKE